jgi:Tol biopolymer transport system component/DNA-binding winged helix-turn-helix (wHTH) protein
MGELVRFGFFEVDLEQRVLRKAGVPIRLQAQPFQVLSALLEIPGAVVTREVLRRRIWSNDTFVDFEHGLNAAVTRLRQALGDSAAAPRFIETVPKSGYRFIAAVEREAVQMKAPAPPGPGLAARHGVPLWMIPAILLSPIGIAVVFFVSGRAAPEAARPVPLTAFRGYERDPALSPDGRQVAFVWNGEKQDNFDIYVMQLDSERPVRLTTDRADDVSPTWSPDGRTIAFLRQINGDHGELIQIPVDGGLEYKIADIRDRELRLSPARLVSLAWSPDGQWIAVSHREPGDFTERIYLISRTGELRPLTSPSASYGDGDHMPAFSSDGRALAFTRLPGWATSDIYQLRLDSTLHAAGEVRRLTTGKRWCAKPVWLPGKDRILYLEAEEPGSPHELRITTAGQRRGTIQRIPLHDEPSDITVSLNYLVYSSSRTDVNIWRARIPPVGEAPSVPTQFISSTRKDERPRYSPDGSKIAFTSSRSGTPEIWVSNADSSSPVRLTTFGGPLIGYASWSPDGKWLAFHARPEGQADIFVMPAAGGAVKRLTSDPADDTVPTYSHDGLSIYFSSARSGQLEIWKMPAAGGKAVQLTTSGAVKPYESPDGKSIFYMTLDFTRIESVPVGGGPPSKIAGPLHGYPSAFDVTAEGIYYEAPPHAADQRFVRFFSFATAQSTPVAVTNRQFVFGMSISPDGRYVLFDQIDESGSDLMLVRGFHPP